MGKNKLESISYIEINSKNLNVKNITIKIRILVGGN